jgi:predicted RNA binding protein YcfA (HicA-like mRNA interferase family)
MTTKQLQKLAKVNGWTLHRNGGKHYIYRHEDANKQITIPYQVKSFVGHNIAKQLVTVGQ